MNSNNLVSMANQIGDFFKAMPDHDEALDGIADHIKKFWDPRMRRALVAHMDASKGKDIHPFVLQALESRREKWI